MVELIRQIEQEIIELEEMIQSLKHDLRSYPEGKLQINHSNGCVQYYFRDKNNISSNSSRPKPKYIRKENRELAQKLAQKEYDKKVLKILEERIQVAKKMKEVYGSTDPVAVYEDSYSERKKLIVPRYISPESYAEQWQQEVYSKKEFADGFAEIYTVKGERVRSKSEKIIADTLERMGVPYKYECPLELSGNRIIHPDFTVLNKRTREEYYWEHLGMMDDADYVTHAMKRIRDMGYHGVLPGKNLLLTAETKQDPISIRMVNMLIKEYLL